MNTTSLFVELIVIGVGTAAVLLLVALGLPWTGLRTLFFTSMTTRGGPSLSTITDRSERTRPSGRLFGRFCRGC